MKTSAQRGTIAKALRGFAYLGERVLRAVGFSGDIHGRALCRVALGLLMAVACYRPARASDGDEPSRTGSELPNIYLDYNTQYTGVPPGTLALGYRNFVSPIPAAAQLVALNAPLTVDIADWLSAVELDYALNDDQTQGLLAGTRSRSPGRPNRSSSSR